MEVYEVDSIVCRYHVFKKIWTPFIGKDLECKRDVSNTRDAYAVGIMRQEETGLTAIVGHVPKKYLLLAAFSYKEKVVSDVSSRVIDNIQEIYHRGGAGSTL